MIVTQEQCPIEAFPGIRALDSLLSNKLVRAL